MHDSLTPRHPALYTNGYIITPEGVTAFVHGGAAAVRKDKTTRNGQLKCNLTAVQKLRLQQSTLRDYLSPRTIHTRCLCRGVAQKSQFVLLPCMPQHCHANQPRCLWDGSAPFAVRCTTRTRTCPTWRKSPTSEASAWRRSSSVTATAQNMCSTWRAKVRRHSLHAPCLFLSFLAFSRTCHCTPRCRLLL